MTTSKQPLPRLIKFLVGLYNAVPKLCIPGTKYDIGFTILSFVVIFSMRLAVQHFYIDILEFDPNNPRTAHIAACTTSAMHSLLLVPALWSVLRSQPYKPCASILGTPQYYQDAVSAVLQLCTGYMCYDFAFLFLAGGGRIHPDDVAFAAHHLVTVLYMAQTRIIGAGHISAMTLMWSGEFTNPMQNFHLVTSYAIQMAPEDTLWHVFQPYAEILYAFFYVIFRSFVGPVQIVHNAYSLLTKEGRTNIPLFISVLSILMSAGIIIGSIPWTIEAIDMVKDGLHVKYDKNWDYGPRFATPDEL